MAMLVQGNDKLGKNIWHFSIPAVKTCPGKTKACTSVCYANTSYYRYPNVVAAYRKRNAFRLTARFILQIKEEIAAKNIRIVRIHTAGDFDSAEYIRKWIAIARACPRVKFFFYTRSWRVSHLLQSILVLGSLPNVQGFFSCDKDTGPPPKHQKFASAYLAMHDDDVPNFKVDLTFRDKRATKMIRAKDGSLVCPVERMQHKYQSNKLNCESCGICWNRVKWLKQTNRKYKKSLPVLA